MQIRSAFYEFPTLFGESFYLDYYSGIKYVPYGMHIHNCDELLLVKQGTLVNYTNTKVTGHTGSCIIFNKEYQPHQTIVTEGQRYERLNIRFSRTLLNETENELLQMDSFLFPLNGGDDVLFRYAELLREEYDSFGVRRASEKTITMLLHTLLAKVYEIVHNHIEDNADKSCLYIRDILRYIDTHYPEKITVENLTRRFFVGKTKLSKDFRRFTGCTINTYITQLRIRRAREYLIAGESVSNTSAFCGFVYESHFISTFKKETGVTPSAFRRSAELQRTQGMHTEIKPRKIEPEPKRE